MDTTESKIFETAKNVFIRSGLEGARMQEIADEAGINKSLLHYYFRTKEKLFKAVFQYAFKRFLPKADELLNSDLCFEERIRNFINLYIDLLLENPFIPSFILCEINRDPEGVIELFKGLGSNPMKFDTLIREEVEQGNIRQIDSKQLIVNILSMCIFPMAARPILVPMIFNNDPRVFKKFLESRKKEIPDFILKSLVIKE